MEESKEQQSLHRFLQFAIYLSLAFDILLFIYLDKLQQMHTLDRYGLAKFLLKMRKIIIYQHPLYSRCFTLILILLTSVGTLAKKNRNLDPKNAIVYPMAAGLVCLICGLWSYGKSDEIICFQLNGYEIAYMALLLLGTILLHISLDNISKIISAKLGKDIWNVEGESFMQPRRPVVGKYTVSIPMLFYYRKKVHRGFINLENIFRGTMLIGTPGSGKSFGVVMPFIRQLIAKEFCICLYDFKNPDLAKVAYYHYLLAKQRGKCSGYGFHVVNLTEVEKSRRINVLRSDYIRTLADASETAEGLVEALKKGDKSGGSDQFFTQSAVNFLASCIYFFACFENGKYSTFPHIMSFLNCSYEEIFGTLTKNAELASLLSPFMTAYKAQAYNQLEGQIGTLKIFMSRLATKETYWVFSGDDFNLKISSPQSPSILVLANDPNTQNINSACYSLVLNRLTRLLNAKGNLPSALIIDELPTLFVHRIENLIATARSNKVAVLMGLQELPQFQQQYGKDTASTITAVVGNVLSGSVRNKETLEWLERLFGKVKQESESLSIDRAKTSVSFSERLEPLIPAGKIASLKAGEMVGMLASDATSDFSGEFQTSAVNGKVDLNMKAIRLEEENYQIMPLYYDFKGKKEEVLRSNFNRINSEVAKIVAASKESIPQIPKQDKASMKAQRAK
ncbi:type IV secretory system conjugative DNA transfer family protein [Pedobacter sp. GSP4]|uniref:type IV secretory system conjugative DNA transfer family protein n=1 Tax=Pedobacter sp. GSP4 TaxID=3453716 RepID=UPI003EEA6130